MVGRKPKRHHPTLSLWARLLLLALSLLLAGGLLLSRPLPARAGQESCAAISEAQVEGLFRRWNAALQSGDPQQVSRLYSPDALLLPTLSAEARHSPEAINRYFESFLERHPRGRIDSRVLHLGCNEALDAGTYSFELDGQGWVQARYSLLYVYRDGDWQILHHHSSLQPAS